MAPMNLKHVLIGAFVLAACVLGGLWLFLRQIPPKTTINDFQETCIEGQRRGISGDVRPLDDDTEARLLNFCTCVQREVGSKLSDQDIAAIGLQQSTKDANAKLGVILNLCRAQNL
jgi:hypothetical protein